MGSSINRHKHRPFIALDGEGYNSADGLHIYNLLAASDGSYIRDDEGLKTSVCLDYLLKLSTDNPRAIFVSFVFSYDVNMMLQTMPAEKVKELSAKGHCYIYDRVKEGLCYRIEYMPRKILTISKGFYWKKNGERRYKVLTSIKIYDVWGFFQSSFVKALGQFGIGGDKLDYIQSMKDERSEFTVEGFERILEYNAYECQLLVELMDTVRDNMLSVGLDLSSWHGAGAVAAKIFQNNKVKEHLAEPVGEDFTLAVMSAYFGGRVQSLQVGPFENVYAYDIVSAYPTAMNDLPSLANMTQRYTDQFEDHNIMSCYRVKWNTPKDCPVTPFPFREENGVIQWPFSGEGYYWYPEVKAALELYPGCIEIIEGYVFEVDPDARPMDFILPMFEQRKRLKAEGNYAQQCIKLGLNSLYGKTAQGVGYQGAKPPYQCYIYAGYITSQTRATMLRAAMQKPTACISFATDGLVMTEPINVKLGKSLGDWEADFYESAFFVKPGFYRLGDEVIKVRGFSPFSVNFDELVKSWDEEGINGSVAFTNRSFIGMKAASDNRLWGSWVEDSRRLSFYPSRGEPVEVGPGQYRLIPPAYIPGISRRYYKGGYVADPDDYMDEEYSVLDD